MSLARRRAEVAAAEAALNLANQNSRQQLRAARTRIEPWWPWLLVGGSTLAGALLAGPARSASAPSSGSSLMRRLSQMGLALRLADQLLSSGASQAKPSSTGSEPDTASTAPETAAAKANSSDFPEAGVSDAIER